MNNVDMRNVPGVKGLDDPAQFNRLPSGVRESEAKILYHNFKGRGKRINNIRETVVICVKKEGRRKLISLGHSICHGGYDSHIQNSHLLNSYDNFHKEVGRKLAFQRALNGFLSNSKEKGILRNLLGMKVQYFINTPRKNGYEMQVLDYERRRNESLQSGKAAFLEEPPIKPEILDCPFTREWFKYQLGTFNKVFCKRIISEVDWMLKKL